MTTASRSLLWRDLTLVTSVGVLLTLVVSWPVITSPTRLLFGSPIVGRHHDPFTVMQQMAASGAPAPFIQPFTDDLGWLLARVLPAVAAYNLLILWTFPATVVATYLLARYLRAPKGAALFAGLTFSFAPIHLAQAAYHAHIAQTQWLPIYLLALVSFVDRPTIARATGYALAAAALALSSFYLGFIGAVLTPVAILARWLTGPPTSRGWHHLLIPIVVAAACALAGAAAIAVLAPSALQAQTAVGFQAEDLARYGARWWSYLLPPVDHAVLGPATARIFTDRGVDVGLLEQQVSVSWSVLVLAVAAIVVAWRRKIQERRPLAVLAAVGVWALLVSLGASADGCGRDSWMPACQIYRVAPMFRAYARFGLAVHLVLCVMGGFAISWLARASRAGAVLAWTIGALIAFDYTPLPWRAYDVLPTEAHRWAARSPEASSILDCVRPEPADLALPWLMQRRLAFLGTDVGTCSSPELGVTLRALGYSHVIVRRREPEGADTAAGLSLAASFPHSRIYRVTADLSPLVTTTIVGFSGEEFPQADPMTFNESSWQWMRGPIGWWVVRNTTASAIVVEFSLDLQARSQAAIAVQVDGTPQGTVLVSQTPARFTLGPWTLSPGDHIVLGSRAPSSEHGSATVEDSRSQIGFRRAGWRVIGQ